MRISARGRYAPASMISTAQSCESAEPVTAISFPKSRVFQKRLRKNKELEENLQLMQSKREYYERSI
jgi:ribosomal protein L3